MKKPLWITVCVVWVWCGPGLARDWPQWRGPFLNGSTDEKDLPVTWSATQNMKWAAPLPGRGYASPIVCNGRIFLTSTVTGSQRNELVGMCLDESTGKLLWQKVICVGYEGYQSNNQASCSPCADQKMVYFLFGSGVVAGLDYDGKIVWRRDLVREYGPLGAKWGYSASPLLFKDKLYVAVLRSRTPYRKEASDGERLPAKLLDNLDSYLLCMDPATGKNLFYHVRPVPTEGEDRESYATPIGHELDGRAEVILVAGDCLTGHDAATGKETWRWCFNPARDGVWRRFVPSPVVGDGMVYVIRSQDKPKHRPLYALKLGRTGNIPDRAYSWRYPSSDDLLGKLLTTDVCTPLLYKGRLYVLSDVKKSLSCLDAKSGKVIWFRYPGGAPGAGSNFWGSPTGADDKIYVIDDLCTTTVMAADDQFKVLARNRLDDRNCLSTVVAANGCLYIRSRAKLYCIGK